MNNLDNAIENFKKGKIGIFPTDTAFGIGCRMDNETAVSRIYEIRKRPENKPLLVLVSSIKMAEKYVHINDKVRKKLIAKYWPGGLTLILPCNTMLVPRPIRSGGDNLAVRMPDNGDLLRIIEEVGVPIVAPSANFSGGKTPITLAEVDEKIIKMVDFVLSGVCTMKGVSTIIDCTKGEWEIVRKGAVKITL